MFLNKSDYHIHINEMLGGWFFLETLNDDGNVQPIDFLFLEINPAFEAITKLPREEVISRKLSEVLPELGICPVSWLKKMINLVQTSQKISFEQYFSTVDKWYSITASSPEKGLVALLMHDITEQKQKEENLQKRLYELKQNTQMVDVTREALYRSIGELLPYGIWICDAQGKVLYLSDSFLELIGMSLDECQQYGWMQALIPETIERTRQHWEDCVKNGSYWDYEHKIKLRPRGYRTILSRGVPLRDEEGHITNWVGINLDITERKMMEDMLKKDKDRFEELVTERTQELIETQIQLEKSKRLSDIGMLASIVAHELRNPLAVIRTAAYNIKRKNQCPDILKKIQNIEKKVEESDIIISNLLNYSRLKMPHLAPARLDELILETVDFIRSLNHKKSDILIKTNLNAIKGLSFALDSHQLKEVFNNLLINAHQAMKENEEGIITIDARLEMHQIIIEISDNGLGIDEKDLELVFQPFFTRKPKGTGLGLTICKDIINLHNGQIGIESEKGKGTKVLIQLSPTLTTVALHT